MVTMAIRATPRGAARCPVPARAAGDTSGAALLVLSEQFLQPYRTVIRAALEAPAHHPVMFCGISSDSCLRASSRPCFHFAAGSASRRSRNASPGGGGNCMQPPRATPTSRCFTSCSCAFWGTEATRTIARRWPARFRIGRSWRARKTPASSDSRCCAAPRASPRKPLRRNCRRRRDAASLRHSNVCRVQGRLTLPRDSIGTAAGYDPETASFRGSHGMQVSLPASDRSWWRELFRLLRRPGHRDPCIRSASRPSARQRSLRIIPAGDRSMSGDLHQRDCALRSSHGDGNWPADIVQAAVSLYYSLIPAPENRSPDGWRRFWI